MLKYINLAILIKVKICKKFIPTTDDKDDDDNDGDLLMQGASQIEGLASGKCLNEECILWGTAERPLRLEQRSEGEN